jgi:hypothetical protein
MHNGKSTVVSANPNYMAAGGGRAGSVNKPFVSLTAYHLKPGRAAQAGINLKRAFGIDVGLHDFYDNAIKPSNGNRVGAVVE